MDRFVFLLFCALVLVACTEAGRRPRPPKLSKKCPLSRCIIKFHQELGIIPMPPIPKPGMVVEDIGQLIEGAEAGAEGILDDLPIDESDLIPEVPKDMCDNSTNKFLECVDKVMNSTESVCNCRPKLVMKIIMAKENTEAFKMKNCKLPAPHCESHKAEVKSCASKVKDAKKDIKVLAEHRIPVEQWDYDVHDKISAALTCIEDLHNNVEEDCKVKIPLFRIKPMLLFTMVYIKSLGCQIPEPCKPKKPFCEPFEADLEEDACRYAANNSGCDSEDFPFAAMEILYNIKEMKCQILSEVLFFKHAIGCDVKPPFGNFLPDFTDEAMGVARRGKGGGKGKGKGKGKPKPEGEGGQNATMTEPPPSTPSTTPTSRSVETLAKLLKRLLES